jgi:hypothetical protein
VCVCVCECVCGLKFYNQDTVTNVYCAADMICINKRYNVYGR